MVAPTSGGPIVLTYATGVDEQWLLGLSAANSDAPSSPAASAARLQLVVARTRSGTGARCSRRLCRSSVFADGGDTLANRYTQSAVEEAALSAAAATDGVTILRAPPRTLPVANATRGRSANASYLASPPAALPATRGVLPGSVATLAGLRRPSTGAGSA